MNGKIRKVLVANRGEIAIRIFRTLRQMGIKSVALYSNADAGSRHIQCADESYRLEGDTIASTYLNISQIVAHAKHSHADAIHPGYGFLSESSDFSKAVRKSGLVFIGPSDEAIRLMGNKIESRNLVGRLGIPLIQGVTGTPQQLLARADQIGYPLLVKAAAGGGGKGMRIIESANQVKDLLETASKEALNYFGNGEVYIEKYLDKPHHIEIQLLADEHGNMAALFERECSIQRRYQKIIEEAPSPIVTPELRLALMDAARRIGREIGYVNAGTLEFLVTGDRFYFLEMNTRIQVEHPVTEMITGIDIVREQVNVAMGKPLSFSQEDVSLIGHAIEARVYAEDPLNNFMPSPGKIHFYKPAARPGLRVDGYLASGSEVSSMFDPMVSKVISHASTREEARIKLIESLEEYAIHGIKTNIPFLISLLRTPSFITGQADTSFCQKHLGEDFTGSVAGVSDPGLLMAAFVFATRQTGNPECSVWSRLGLWRIQTGAELLINGKPILLNLLTADTSRLLIGDGESQKVFTLAGKSDDTIIVDAQGKKTRLLYSSDAKGIVYLQYKGQVYETIIASRLYKNTLPLSKGPATPEGSFQVNAPMFGRIGEIKVEPQALVNKGDVLLTLESMKMETRITAPTNAFVKKIEVSSGQLVQDKQVLLILSGV